MLAGVPAVDVCLTPLGCERFLAVRGQSAVEFPFVAVLHVDMLVPTGSIEEFLWAEGAWCLLV